MPSALQQSRDILARGVARVRAGIDEYDRRIKSPGPEIEVQPFDAQNVSTPAAMVKLGTSIAAARRKKANLDAAQENIKLEREKTRAEIARMRAAAAYDLGEGRQPDKTTPAGSQIIRSGKYKGMTVDEARIYVQDARSEDARTAAGNRAAQSRRLAQARLGLTQVDKESERITNDSTMRKLAFYETMFANVNNPDPTVRAEALTAVGIDPASWDALEYADGTPIVPARMELIRQARAGLRQRTLARVRSEAEGIVGPRRAGYQAIIDEGIEGVGEDPLGISPTEDDPLGLGAP